ncbi:MAG TPA: glycosyltransferase [Armatimonadota bacterium]|nr:glycosyltransferase [Armatimonadota bacterium]
MRILFVGRNAKIGGGTTFRLNIARGLRERGHEIWLAAQPGEVLPRYRELGVQYVWTPPPPWGGLWIQRAIRANRIDIVHASNASPGHAAEWACLRTGTPLVMSVHGILGKGDHLEGCFQLARKILTFEEVAVERLADHKELIDPGKVLLLRRPIEHRPQFPDDGGPFRVAYVGRLSKRKGRNALNLISAFERFQQTVPESTLQLLGDGTLLRDVRRVAADYNRKVGREAISVLGSVPEPVPIVGRAHVVVGASYCALEAIMQGVAVIAAGFWGYGIIDQDNLRDAMAWNFGDVGGKWEMTEENFLQALCHVHEAWTANRERERYWRLDRLIEDDHSLSNVAGRIEQVYQEVLRGPAPAAAGTGAR